MQGLISAQQLETMPSDWLRLDVRLPADGGRAGYEQGHVPGAVLSDYAGDGWRLRVGNAPGMLPEAAHLVALFARLGITPERPVIVIPVGSNANDFAASARVYWTLRHAGHSQLTILDGGTKGWTQSGRPLETGWREPQPAAPFPLSWRPGLRVLADTVLSSGKTLLDARASSYFNGTEKAPEARIGGHIPGAHSLDYTSLFDPVTHALKPRAVLEAALSHLPPGPVISYCNTGHTAALNWFVLSEILGRDTALYDGSMTEWTQDPSRPVATASVSESSP